MDNLKITSRYGVDYSTIEEYNYYNPFFGDFSSNDPSTTGLFYTRYNRLFNWVWTNLADYGFHAWQDKISGHVTAGYEAQKSMQLTEDATGIGLPLTTSIVYPSPVTAQTPTYTGSDYAFNSLLSKADVSFLNRYTLSGSIRRDGSSRFGSDNRFGTFWSVGGAWNIDQENFMQNVRFYFTFKTPGFLWCEWQCRDRQLCMENDLFVRRNVQWACRQVFPKPLAPRVTH